MKHLLLVLTILLSILIIAPNSNAARTISMDGVRYSCLELGEARSVFADLEACQEKDQTYKSIIVGLKEELNTDNEIIANMRKQISLLDENINSQEKMISQYKLSWQKCSEALSECENSKPSRATWFGAGMGTSLGIILLILLL